MADRITYHMTIGNEDYDSHYEISISIPDEVEEDKGNTQEKLDELIQDIYKEMHLILQACQEKDASVDLVSWWTQNDAGVVLESFDSMPSLD